MGSRSLPICLLVTTYSLFAGIASRHLRSGRSARMSPSLLLRPSLFEHPLMASIFKENKADHTDPARSARAAENFKFIADCDRDSRSYLFQSSVVFRRATAVSELGSPSIAF